MSTRAGEPDERGTRNLYVEFPAQEFEQSIPARFEEIVRALLEPPQVKDGALSRRAANREVPGRLFCLRANPRL